MFADASNTRGEDRQMYMQQTEWGWSLFTEDDGLIASCDENYVGETLRYYLTEYGDPITIKPGYRNLAEEDEIEEMMSDYNYPGSRWHY
jgi:hypothetical protein